jgi:hypothetical protein
MASLGSSAINRRRFSCKVRNRSKALLSASCSGMDELLLNGKG